MSEAKKIKFLPTSRSTYVLFAIGLALTLLASALFINRMTTIVHEETLDSMAELANHDINYIETELDHSLRNVSDIANNLREFDIPTIADLQDVLWAISNDSQFQFLYVIDSQGNVYKDDHTIMPREQNPFMSYFKAGETEFVHTLSFKPTPDLPRSRYLLYGMDCEPFTIQDVTFVSIVGTNDASIIQQTLKIDSFNGVGFSSVINYYGNYLVNVDGTEATQITTSFFADIQEGTIQGTTADAIIADIKAERPVQFNWTDSEGTELITLSKPLSMNKWSFIMTVPVSALQAKSMQLVSMTAWLIIIIIVIGTTLVLVYIRSARKRTAEVARAQARNEFLSSLSHEIRTPITGMVGLNELMRLHVDDPERMKKLIGQSETSTKYLLSLVNDILDMSRLEAGKTDFVLAPVNVDEMITDACMMQRETYHQRGVELKVDVHITHPWIMTDPLHAKQAIMNILGNASKFTPEGGVVKLTAYQTAAWDAPDMKGKGDRGSFVAEGRDHIDTGGDESRTITVIEIDDTGIGMTPDFLKSIFDPFAQERTRSNAKQKGTGLGMAISHDLVIALGGTIQVDSELGKGSRFTIVLPAQITEEPPEEAASSQTPPAADSDTAQATLADMSILFADDNDLNASIIMDILQEEGVGNIVRAANGQEIVDLFSASQPGEYDLILSDINMPVMNGYEAASAVRKLERPDAASVLILACSANTVEEDGANAKDAGMNGFLEKPVQPEQVVAAYNALLNDPDSFYAHH